jgi:DNA-binding transcriptional regulator YdaS (Cro superfamily)
MVPRDVPVAYTAKSDVGRALAELALLALSPATASSVPDSVRIAGCSVSAAEVARALEGAGLEEELRQYEEANPDVKEVDEARERLKRDQPTTEFAGYMR